MRFGTVLVLALLSGCGRVGYDSQLDRARDGQIGGRDGAVVVAQDGDVGRDAATIDGGGGTDATPPPMCRIASGSGFCGTQSILVGPFATGDSSGSTDGMLDERASSCGGGGAPEMQMTAQALGSGAVDFVLTTNDAFEAAVSVFRDDTCSGEEIICMRARPSSPARWSMTLADGDRISIVIDGAAPGQCGRYTLEFAPGTS